MTATQNICQRLNDTPDYGIALLLDGVVTAAGCLERYSDGQGCPFLAMAEGPLGVLRALEVRMGPLDRLEGTYTLAAAKLENGKPRMHHWILNFGN